MAWFAKETTIIFLSKVPMRSLLGILIAAAIFCFVFACDADSVDLEKDIASYILEEKQIVIPGYPDAFNPSIVRWCDGRLLLSFRARDPLTNSTHLMGFAWLNEDFEVIGRPTLLTIYGGVLLKRDRAQDPRL